MADSKSELPPIRSYREFRKAVKGQTAEQLQALYDRDYYERHVGNEELARVYFESLGLEPTIYTRRPIELAAVRPGDRLLDVGCGRGEVVFQTAQLGALSVGLDFSQSAIDIACATRDRLPAELAERTTFVRADARQIEFPDGFFDKVCMLDVVEHVSSSELRAILGEVRRVLVPKGRLVVHTTPNRWARTYGYWLRSAACRLGRRPVPTHPIVAQAEFLASDPRYDARSCLLHINEQSVLSLKLALRRSGFRSRVWLEHTGDPWTERRDGVGRLLHGFYRGLALKLYFGSGIFAVASPSRES